MSTEEIKGKRKQGERKKDKFRGEKGKRAEETEGEQKRKERER